MSIRKKVLITGFSGLDNPSRIVAEEFSKICIKYEKADIKTLVLSSSYTTCETQFYETIIDFEPDIIISLGVASNTNSIRLERVAVNLDDCWLQDENGIKFLERKIVPDGPVGYFSSLPLKKIYITLKESHIPVRYSNYAGNYLCNHILYFGLHTIDKLKLRSIMGFIHIPKIKQEKINLESLLEVVNICVDASIDGVNEFLLI